MPTIKTKKEMNLAELIEWITENDITYRQYIPKLAENTRFIAVNGYGEMRIYEFVRPDDVFTVEIEEEITEDTVFKQLIEASEDDLFVIENGSINTERDNLSESFYAYINGEIILIWTKEKGLV